MTAVTDYIFEQLEEQGIVFKSANNLLHISISASDYLDIKRLAKEMEKKQIIDAYANAVMKENNSDYIGMHEQSNGEIYFNETYGSKGSDDHIVDTNEMVSSQTEIAMIIPEAISILKIHQQWRLGADIVMIEPKELTKAIDVLINYHIDIMNEKLSSQTEISDEEIENCVGDGMHDFYKGGFIEGAKWHREQIRHSEFPNKYSINKDKRTVTYNGTKTQIQKKSFEVLCYIYDNKNRIVTRAEIYKNVWEGLIVDERTIDVHVRTLRKAIPNIPLVVRKRIGIMWEEK